MTSWEWLVEAEAMGWFAEPVLNEVERWYLARGLLGGVSGESENRFPVRGL